jgi:hypothetical protein
LVYFSRGLEIKYPAPYNIPVVFGTTYSTGAFHRFGLDLIPAALFLWVWFATAKPRPPDDAAGDADAKGRMRGRGRNRRLRGVGQSGDRILNADEE